MTVMPLERFLQDYHPAYFGPTWAHVVARMQADDVDRDLVEALGEELQRDGRFAEPVIIDPDTAVVRDGMHRIVALIVAGADDIDVLDDWPDLPDRRQLHVEFDTPLHDDEHEQLFDVLRSFRWAGGWANCDGMGGTRKGGLLSVSGTWECRDGMDDQLVEALRARAAAYGIVLGPARVEVADYDD